jgi:LemA protein
MASLSKLMALAEQYPDLKLSSNFQSLMAALIEVEKDLATERIKLNDMVNTYTTNVAKFPCNMFAVLYGFPRSPYFEATEEAKAFKLITY